MYSVCRRKKPRYKKDHKHKTFLNLLGQDFKVEKLNQVWCTDFTYLYLSNGTVRYNCSIIDLHDRSIVATKNGRWMTSTLAKETMEKALAATKADPKDLMLHSDQGSQFASLEFTWYCQERGITQSMGNAGCPYDNAPMERYYNTLKEELIYQYRFDTAEELDYAVAEFAYKWYNQVRPHSYNDYLTPFEKRYGLR